ncbi:hypothetical protein QNM99_21845 [Pseudomonas sp. PCH446]
MAESLLVMTSSSGPSAAASGHRGVVVFGNQNAHGSNLSKTVQAAADRVRSIVIGHCQKIQSI